MRVAKHRTGKALVATRRALRTLEHAAMHLNPYDSDAAQLLGRAMDRVENERRRLLNLNGRKKLPMIIVSDK